MILEVDAVALLNSKSREMALLCIPKLSLFHSFPLFISIIAFVNTSFPFWECTVDSESRMISWLDITVLSLMSPKELLSFSRPFPFLVRIMPVGVVLCCEMEISDFRVYEYFP